jgi:hypothetical protein
MRCLVNDEKIDNTYNAETTIDETRNTSYIENNIFINLHSVVMAPKKPEDQKFSRGSPSLISFTAF